MSGETESVEWGTGRGGNCSCLDYCAGDGIGLDWIRRCILLVGLLLLPLGVKVEKDMFILLELHIALWVGGIIKVGFRIPGMVRCCNFNWGERIVPRLSVLEGRTKVGSTP